MSDDEAPERYERVLLSSLTSPTNGAQGIIRPSLVNKLVNTMTTQHNIPPTNELRTLMSKEKLRVWNRVRVLNDGNAIRMSRVDIAEENRRCASFVAVYGVSIDRNRRHPARRVEFEGPPMLW
ncbi:hypothetical protein J010_01260 [Cryptococcus neoformans]|uniref:Uncharacterized protein n=1 Tax=Cryptococcus neoformans Tu259-1 TaxID=1230072 RepID=A0A854QMU8_CRYNE|nr:hypothetical protein C353_01303 [Cryptococcus neoformans var. grubii AD1-83a]OXG26517.1 hypothetical protein C361_01276 [Cryptococcus neoformans var. grubii Tu259-1]OXG52826.1 hypothetical protein C355_01387 [Cryptococcus neoformans var. grubii Th84]OXG66427.1 hypothetical protein C354_01313 [Cryptococcus neoformans var. grubii MW-RSA1955]OXG67618.1 hypothetical protein C351_01136 [Cryptococcus neoformans var. grubii c8]OXG70701.1 hypothetical protein C352_01320 [Cryptococcus neoformans var